MPIPTPNDTHITRQNTVFFLTKNVTTKGVMKGFFEQHFLLAITLWAVHRKVHVASQIITKGGKRGKRLDEYRGF